MLDRVQRHAQARLLSHMQQLATIHGLRVLVKCLDYLSAASDDADAEEEKKLYLNMLAARSKAEIIHLWDSRPAAGVHQYIEEPRTAEHRISSVIDSVRWHRDLGDADVHNQVEPEIVAALAAFAKVWNLDEFVETHERITSEPPNLNAAGVSKLQAQFILQAQVAETSLTSDNGATPTISISFVPDGIPNVTLINIKKHWRALFVPLARRVKESEKSLRQDLFTMQLISLGSAHGKGGQQWKELDDLGQAGMDVISHLHLDADQILLRGPGPLLGQKMMLGSVAPAIDKNRAKRESEAGLYGAGDSQVTVRDMNACVCQNRRLAPGAEYAPLSPER
ncbi:hypothetical protein CGMCC3_g12953 [Colletotrichum fructicola]|nr:uncharacterized protein CGMCC3_g12953 [Colletotrichum fructicola]KAE9571006.1 hypothetical protein CGMCC3_g12953 [Colletotrichum fructicola]KAF4416299.1 hypothetical protein CFRS1_v016088 [Colletotrichum fructicola]KAF4880990.1 hypothetical protein CGCFRS4_v016005 [Colletotrichum fructicola]